MNKEPNKAEARTDWAEDRTELANERTFAAWMRTGLTSVAVAIGLQAVFKDLEPTWLAKAVSSGFIVGALVIFVAADLQAVKTHRRLDVHAAAPQSIRRIRILTTLMLVASLGTAAILWLI